jgi:hypothetical protein
MTKLIGASFKRKILKMLAKMAIEEVETLIELAHAHLHTERLLARFEDRNVDRKQIEELGEE